jgi:polyferredoxin
MASLFSSLFRRAPPAPTNAIVFPFTIEANPYRCKRIWPPEFENLSEKHKFRLERRYRRRAKLKWARPNWTKGVKLATWASITFVIVYGVLFMETEEGTPFDGVSGHMDDGNEGYVS